MEALQKLHVRSVTEAWIQGLGDGGWDDDGRGGRRVMLIPVNEGNSQAPLAEPYS